MKIILLLFSLFFLTAGSGLEVQDAWLRPADAGMNSALYLKIQNNSDKADTLYKVTFADANMAMMHETYKKGDLTGMKMVKNIVVNAHSTFEFKPGSFHIMLMKLKKNLKPKSKETFKLFFKSGKEIEGSAFVKNY